MEFPNSNGIGSWKTKGEKTQNIGPPTWVDFEFLVKALNSKDSPVEWKSLALTGGRESKSMRADWVMGRIGLGEAVVDFFDLVGGSM